MTGWAVRAFDYGPAWAYAVLLLATALLACCFVVEAREERRDRRWAARVGRPDRPRPQKGEGVEMSGILDRAGRTTARRRGDG